MNYLDMCCSRALVMCVCLTLIGCGGSGGTDNNDNDEESVVTPQAEAPLAGRVTISVPTGFSVTNGPTDSDPSVFNTSQLLFRIANDDNTIACLSRVVYYQNDPGIDTALAQFSVNTTDATVISVNDIVTNGVAGVEYLVGDTQDNGIDVVIVNNYYYFKPEQVVYNQTTLFNVRCFTATESYAQNEAVMQSILDTAVFD